MNPEEPKVSEQEARAAAQQMVELFRLPLKLVSGQDDIEHVLGMMRRAFLEPKALEDELVAHIMSSATAEQFAKDSALLGQMLRAPRRILSEVAKDWPRGTAGRTKRSTGTDQQIAEFAAWLLPMVQVLVRERARLTKRSVGETIQYLEADFPEQAQYLLQHLARVEAALSDTKLARAKTMDAKSRAIAFVLTGNEFGMNRGYALRQVQSAIRRHTKPRT